MRNKPRIVIDTNSIVSALIFKQSVVRSAFDKARHQGVLLASPVTIQEITEVLKRPKFDKYVSAEDRDQFLFAYLELSFIVITRTTVSECRDPKDNKFLELAVDGQANCIVTGDEDLLVLNPFRGVSVLTARQYLETPF